MLPGPPPLRTEDDTMRLPLTALAFRPDSAMLLTEPPAGPNCVAADGTDARLAEPRRGVLPLPLRCRVGRLLVLTSACMEKQRCRTVGASQQCTCTAVDARALVNKHHAALRRTSGC